MMIRNSRTSCKVFAPASVANVSVGFDILGFSVPVLGDEIMVEKTGSGVEIVSITGVVSDLPMDPKDNTAGTALLKMCEELGLDHGFKITNKGNIFSFRSTHNY
ncbi:MAG: hypothetical protein IH840_14795 [Candidatus Heimdallarchaeota archaeon]|nr:hypothetical protein [Candidatus Heimdallarchaeota archaeon]